MRLGYPERPEEVDRYSTFELVRAKTLLPEPTTNEELVVMERIDSRLCGANVEHRTNIEGAIGYGPR